MNNISPTEANLTEYRIIDVREPDEFSGELGHVCGAELHPLGELNAHAETWARDQPLLVICKRGGRSAKAYRHLISMGFTNVTNLVGGMMAWNEDGLEVQ
jgi:sulfur dioxygenase